ncbi:MAG: hypothetical protein V1922_01920 [bacterium]
MSGIEGGRPNVAIFTQENDNRFYTEPAVNRVFSAASDIIRNKTIGRVPHLGAGILASEARAQGWDVSYLDFDPNKVVAEAEKYSLIFLSALDISVDRVNSILDSNPNLDGKVVVGGQGISPIANEFASKHPDTGVVEGRGEGVCKTVLNDFSQQGYVKGLYRRKYPLSLADADKEPYMDPEFTFRNDVKFKDSIVKPLELSTGCTQACSMCPVGGEKVTVKPLSTIKTEIDMMRLRPQDILLFVDHNLLNANRNYLLQLFTYINERGIRWTGEGTISQIIKDDQLLRVMAKNSLSILSGLETIDEGLTGSQVKDRLRVDFAHVNKVLRSVGFPVTWSMVFPLDSHSPESFLQTAKFIWDHKIDVNMHLLQPRLGSELYDTVTKEDRWIDTDSRMRDGVHLVYQQKKMSREEAIAGYVWLKGKITSPAWLYRKFVANMKELGPRKAVTLLGLAISTDGLMASRIRQVYPELHTLLDDYEARWQQMIG